MQKEINASTYADTKAEASRSVILKKSVFITEVFETGI